MWHVSSSIILRVSYHSKSGLEHLHLFLGLYFNGGRPIFGASREAIRILLGYFEIYFAMSMPYSMHKTGNCRQYIQNLLRIQKHMPMDADQIATSAAFTGYSILNNLKSIKVVMMIIIFVRPQRQTGNPETRLLITK